MKRWPAILLIAAMISTACATRSAAPQPPTIHYGEDVSAGCGMIISDPRFATAALAGEHDPLLFDDIGDYLSYAQTHHLVPEAVFVHDYRTKEWLRAETAWYLLSPSVRTPMGSGLAAFSEESAARQVQAKESGEVLSWHDLTSRVWSDGSVPAGSHSE